MHTLVWTLVEPPYWPDGAEFVDTFIEAMEFRGPGSSDERPPNSLNISFYRFRESVHRTFSACQTVVPGGTFPSVLQ
jgi:hypothetical protein